MTDIAPASPWPQGWCPQARHIASPNFGPRPPGTAINLAVIHSISLPPGIYGGDEIERLFTNRLDWSTHPYFEQIRGAEVSAHFVIRRDGELLQFVSADDRAWHAGLSSWQGRDNCNDYAIGIELEGLEDEPFEPAQYMALASLLKQARMTYPLDHIAGHEHVAPGRKRDPGKAFDWAGLQALLGWPSSCFPGAITSP
ncbi:MAG: 1,6-anhydro-N-acetylmuramyl-L-alanine amidase AmpD [Pseudomonas sp.]|uniref:1,6-anhydro-N-acetylmuramyl-L-alanine amidase AmpD n=1 Tax=Pseudomonas sp. TaxID=306 RepID=UPI00121D270E|nr:1,6-anhydro-N-acetylmuramyl-L-alanine amidase AmpD [Pseudomonas sp.]RZI71121.1 MAG: 1,6-anhydro-N-acetylmuramyl-L-alanine amidase AmpD [Pseudomonas sp.]